jgi:predicted nucleic acid-binding protein
MLVVDASVWIAAADKTDVFHDVSRAFLVEVGRQQLTLYLPAFAWLETACALARKRGDAATGLRLAGAILDSPLVTRVPLDERFLSQAIQVGTRALLRGADAIYAAAAILHTAGLVSWDAQLIRRAGALTPADWLAARS